MSSNQPEFRCGSWHLEVRDSAGLGLPTPSGILGVEPGLDRVTERSGGLGRQLLAGRDGQLQLDEVGPGGHYLGCEHTQANFKSAFWRSDLFDYKPFETWAEEGSRDTMQLAAERVAKQLGDYQQPHLDEGTREALDAYVAQRKESMPDAFI